MEKVDFEKKLKNLYSASVKEPALVEVPSLTFLMIDGRGDPTTAPSYREAIETLYPVAYALKFMVKKEDGIDYGVLPLEGLWWAEDMSVFTTNERSQWQWTMMIMQPDYVTRERFERAVEQVSAKKNPPALAKIRLESYADGLCAQIMHLGPYTDEGPTIKKLHDYIHESGYVHRSKHREIYLNDARKTAPERLKTIIRQPVEGA